MLLRVVENLLGALRLSGVVMVLRVVKAALDVVAGSGNGVGIFVTVGLSIRGVVLGIVKAALDVLAVPGIVTGTFGTAPFSIGGIMLGVVKSQLGMAVSEDP